MKIPFLKPALIIGIILIMVVAVFGFIPDFGAGGNTQRKVVECSGVVGNPIGLDTTFIGAPVCTKHDAGLVDCAIAFAIPVLQDENSVKLVVGDKSVVSSFTILEATTHAFDLKTCVNSDPSTARVSVLNKDGTEIIGKVISV